MTFSMDQFRTNFREYEMPSLLADLFVFQDGAKEFYSRGFELDVITLDFFKSFVKEENVPQFFGFGHDGEHSVYALWLFKPMPLSEAPVVYLNIDGEGSRVLASNLSDFLTLLAYGLSPEFGVYSAKKASDKWGPPSRNQEFCTWLKQHYDLQPATNPNELVQSAHSLYPALPLKI